MQNINPEFWLFFLTILFLSSNFYLFLRILSSHIAILLPPRDICEFKLTILATCKPLNLDFSFSNYEFISHLAIQIFFSEFYIWNSLFWVYIKKKSEFWDKKSQLTWRKRSSIAYSGQASIRHHKRIIQLSTGGQIFRSVVDHWVLMSKWKMYLLFNCIILNKPIILNQNILTQFSSELSDFSLMMYTRLPQSCCPLKLRPFLTINYKLASRSASICLPCLSFNDNLFYFKFVLAHI